MWPFINRKAVVDYFVIAPYHHVFVHKYIFQIIPPQTCRMQFRRPTKKVHGKMFTASRWLLILSPPPRKTTRRRFSSTPHFIPYLKIIAQTSQKRPSLRHVIEKDGDSLIATSSASNPIVVEIMSKFRWQRNPSRTDWTEKSQNYCCYVQKCLPLSCEWNV